MKVNQTLICESNQRIWQKLNEKNKVLAVGKWQNFIQIGRSTAIELRASLLFGEEKRQREIELGWSMPDRPLPEKIMWEVFFLPAHIITMPTVFIKT